MVINQKKIITLYVFHICIRVYANMVSPPYFVNRFFVVPIELQRPKVNKQLNPELKNRRIHTSWQPIKALTQKPIPPRHFGAHPRRSNQNLHDHDPHRRRAQLRQLSASIHSLGRISPQTGLRPPQTQLGEREPPLHTRFRRSLSSGSAGHW